MIMEKETNFTGNIMQKMKHRKRKVYFHVLNEISHSVKKGLLGTKALEDNQPFSTY